VDITLVTGVPDELFAWCLENLVERHGKFDHSEAGSEVTPDLGDHIHVAFAGLHDQFVQLFPRKRSDVFGSVYLVQ